MQDSANTHSVYGAVIGDGYLYEVVASDDNAPAGPRYWYALRNMEVACPQGCDGSDPLPAACFYCVSNDRPDADCSECSGAGVPADPCEVCAGTGLSSGEPFEVLGLSGLTAEEAQAIVSAVDAGGDGYARMRLWRAATRGGSETVCEWDP